MNTQADKTQDNKGQSVAGEISQMQKSGEATFQLSDNRPEAIAQRKLQEMVNGSPQVKQLRAGQEMANNSLQAKQTAQLQPEESIQKKENKTGLPDNLKAGVESLSGYSMDEVKVHRNSDKPAQLNAHAYAQGNDIHVAPGQEQHLPHEAWHVVQQAQGRVKPTLQMKGVMVNDDLSLENEADQMGNNALSAGKADSMKMPVLRKSWSAAHFPAQLITVYRGMKANIAKGVLPLQKDATKHLGVRDADVPAKFIVGGMVQHGAGMSTSKVKAGVPDWSVSKSYPYGSDKRADQAHADFLWNWSFDTANLPANLRENNNHGDHVLIEPAVSGALDLAGFRAAVQGTQANWVRVDPPAPVVAAPILPAAVGGAPVGGGVVAPPGVPVVLP
jgi:hypothetical protein